MYCENCGRETGNGAGGRGAAPARMKRTARFGTLKVVAVIAAVMLALLLTACGNKTDGSGSGGNKSDGEEKETLRFDTPEEQYRYVEGSVFKNAGESLAAAFDSAKESVSLSDQRVDAEMLLEVFDPAANMLETYTGIDFSWLKTLGINADVNLVEEEGLSLDMALSLNGRELIGADFLMDTARGTLYGRIPRLSNGYFQAEFDAQAFNYGYNMMRQQQLAVFDMLPEGETISKLISRCADAALEEIKTVDEGSGTLSAGDISAKYTTLKLTLTEELLQDMAEAVCDVLKEDKDVEDIIANFEEMYGTSFYDEFLDGLDRLPEQIRLPEDIDIILYVDEKNEIRGRVIEAGDYIISYAMPEDGNDFGLVVSMEDARDGEIYWSLSGEGQRSGNTLEGEFTLETQGTELLLLSVEGFDTKRLEDGELIGRFTIRPTYDCYNFIGADSLTARTLEAFSLALDLGRNEAAIEIYMDGEPFLALTERVERGRAERLPTISGAEDVDSWSRSLLTGGTVQEFLEYLKGSDIPEELLQQLLGAAF